MGWPSAAAIWAFLVTVGQAIGWFMSGVLKEKQREAAESEKATVGANQATNGVDAMSRSAKLQYLERRGRVRGSARDGGSH